MDLLERTGTMSIMQMVAYHTLTMVYKVIQTGKPEYIANKVEVVHGSELERRAGVQKVSIHSIQDTRQSRFG